MGFTKDDKNINREGRPAGAINVVTKQVREQIEKVLSEHFTPELLAEDLKAVEPYERLKLFMRLLEFIVPKQRSTELKLDFEVLSDQDLDRIIEKLTNIAENEADGKD